MQLRNYKKGGVLDWTPSSDISGGVPQTVGPFLGLPNTDIKDGVEGALQIGGIVKGVCDDSVGVAGQAVGWDEDGDPVGGTAGSGAFTVDLWEADEIVGTLAKDKAADDTHMIFILNRMPAGCEDWPVRNHLEKDGNATVAIKEAGCVLHVSADEKTITLPAAAAANGSLVVTVVNDAPGAAGDGVTVAVGADEFIKGQNIDGGSGKNLVNTRATARKGDFATFVSSGDGATNNWMLIAKRGVWAIEP